MAFFSPDYLSAIKSAIEVSAVKQQVHLALEKLLQASQVSSGLVVAAPSNLRSAQGNAFECLKWKRSVLIQ